MQYSKKVLENKKVEFTVNVSKEEWDGALENAYQKNKNRYNLQGFRKGHAPRAVIEKAYGDTIFYDDAIEDCYYRYYFEILKTEKDLKPIGYPEVNVSKIDENGLELVLRIEEMPVVELGSYKGYTIEKNEVKVTDNDIAHELEHLRESKRSYKEDNTATLKLGDFAVIDFTGYIDDKKFDGGEAKDFELELGSHTFIDTFEDQLVGLKVGDEKDVKVTFPKDYHQKDLSNKPAVFQVKVKKVKSKNVPELNDAFADDVSEFATLDELKADLKKKIEQRKNLEENARAEEKLIEMIVDSAKVDLPQALIDEQIDMYIHDFKHKLEPYGFTVEQYLEQAKMTMEDLRNLRVEDAKKTAKTRLVLNEIIAKENIAVTDDEIIAKFGSVVEGGAKTVDEIRKHMSDEEFDYYTNSLKLNKLIKFLKENNNL